MILPPEPAVFSLSKAASAPSRIVCLRPPSCPPLRRFPPTRHPARLFHGFPNISPPAKVCCGRSRSRSPGRRRCRPNPMPTRRAAMTDAPPAPKLVLLPVADGSEEMEVVIVADVLRRAGADVTLASVGPQLQVVASRNVNLVADAFISACEGHRYDLIVLPGGMPGAAHLRDSRVLRQLTQIQAQENRPYAAICAAPAVALKSWGLLERTRATCHPSFAGELSGSSDADENVVTDGLVTTSRGPGTGFEFALSLVKQLYGEEKVQQVATPMVLRSDNGQRPPVHEYNGQDWKFHDTGSSFNVLVPIANGSEEMEVVIIVDVLRRAGFNVVVASVERELQIAASRNVKIVADKFLHQMSVYDMNMIILPGGMPGAQRLRDCDILTKLLSKQVEEGKPVGAICAAPAVIFESEGLLKGKKATCHPAFSAKLSDQTAVDARVVIDGLTVTSRGPGTAMEFALSIVEKVLGHGKARNIADALVLPFP